MQRGSNRREDPAQRSRGHKGKHRSTAGTEEQWAQGNTGHRVSGKLRPKTRETRTLSIVTFSQQSPERIKRHKNAINKCEGNQELSREKEQIRNRKEKRKKPSIPERNI